jgi:hypothetical protein
MNTIDTRDLIEERDNLKTAIFDSFIESFPQYEEMTETFDDILFEEEEIQNWKEDWEEELNSIDEINELEEEIGSEFDYGVTLIEEDDFEDFVEQDLEDLGYIPKDFPSWIVIDWEATSNNVQQDYSEVEFRGTTYFYW